MDGEGGARDLGKGLVVGLEGVLESGGGAVEMSSGPVCK